MLPDRAIRLGAAMAFLLAALSGCRQELPAGPELPDNPAEGETVVLTASLQPAEGKATLDFPSVLWDDDDEIAVFDGSSRIIFTIPEGENKGSTARFTGNASPSATDLYAVYPASGGESLSSGVLGICIPSVQTVPDGKCADPLALVSVAHAADGNLFFRQVTALLRLELISSDVQQIRICGNSLAGKALVNPDGTIAEVTAGEHELLLQPQDGCFAPGVYYAVVLPGVTPAGAFTITVVRSGGLSGTRTANPQVTFVRRRGLDMGEVEAALTWRRVICTRQQLFEWNLSREVSDATDEVELGADIDMSMEAWTPRNFAGTFDGKGHRLWNLNAVSDNYAGFLREMTGAAVLKDITIGSSDGSTYDGASIIRHGASANNYTWYYAGVVAKASGSSSISGVQNFATVEVAADAVSKTRIGGIVGNWNSSGTLTSCVNRGTVQNVAAVTGCVSESDATAATSILGGIVGFFDKRCELADCFNYGNVRSTNPGVSAVGGVVGYDARGSSLSGCNNYGHVAHEAASLIAETAAGGVIGYAKGSSSLFANINSCSNEGPVSASGDCKIIRVGGVSGYTDYCTVSSCINTAAVSFSNPSAVSGYVAIGGVCAHTYHGCVISNCRNEGAISSDKPQVNRIGGVVGSLNSSAIRDCTNAGPIELDNASSAIENWIGAGGITGFSEGATDNREILRCTNTGSVSVKVNTIGHSDYHRCCVGGIVGMPFTSMTISGNENRGDVTMENVHAGAPYAYAGGIFGQDSGASSASAVSGNLNYGTVGVVSGRNGYSAAGGLFGNIAMATIVSDNCNFGSVQGTDAGAVAGVNVLSFKVVVCDALTVNGIAYKDASDKAVWASPVSSGTITLEVHPHSETETGSLADLPKPLDPGNKVVAHRGGATECGLPDNSRAALRYAMSLGCYASECDIYWTADNNVIVAHAKSDDTINGFHPWEATAAEIIAAKRLSNYEKIPTLEEYLDIVMSAGSKTKLCLDIKMIDTPSLNYDYPAKAALRALEIIQAKGAQNYVEFICTSYEQVMKKVASQMKAAGIPCGWMNGGISASSFKSKGYTDWANLNTRDHMSLGVSGSEDKGSGKRTIKEYKDAGVQLSVFHLDKQSGNSSAVYTEENVSLYLNEYQYLRCITTNYPAWLINKTKDL